MSTTNQPPDQIVLTRMTPRTVFTPFKEGKTRIGLAVDTETTGVDPGQDKIIEIALILFEYCPVTGTVYHIVDRYTSLEDPGIPITAEITEVTGIHQDMVIGKKIDDEAVAHFFDSADVVVAHNAGFDRRFIEKRFGPISKPWVCSFKQVPWQEEGVTVRVLAYLLFVCARKFCDAHRAEIDAFSLIEVLAGKLPKSGRSVMLALLTAARIPSILVLAHNAPFEAKKALRARMYEWSDGQGAMSKGWWKIIPETDLEQERLFLTQSVYGAAKPNQMKTKKITAQERFSDREAL